MVGISDARPRFPCVEVEGRVENVAEVDVVVKMVVWLGVKDLGLVS